MVKHPSCAISVLVVDQLGPNTLCAIPYLKYFIFSYVILSCFTPFFLFFGFSYDLNFALITRSLISDVCKSQAYELQAIELIMWRRVLQVACVAANKQDFFF